MSATMCPRLPVALRTRNINTLLSSGEAISLSSGESTLISGREITSGKQDIRRNNPVSIELESRVSFHLFQCWTT